MIARWDDLVLAVGAGWLLREFADRWLRPLPRARAGPPETRHVYLSPACWHEEHRACTRGCAFCPSLCLCVCHRGQDPLEV